MDTLDVIEWVEDFFLRHKKALSAVFGTLFALFCLTFLIGAFAAGGCREESIPAHKRVAYCNVSLVAGTWADIFPLEYRRRSEVRLERGIALLQAGRPQDARAGFAKAVNALLLYPEDNYVFSVQRDIIASHQDPRIAALWRQVLDDAMAVSGADAATIARLREKISF